MRSLSKSRLMSARQCPRRLWLEVHRPGLARVSADTQAAFATGHEVGEVARQLYGGDDGHWIDYDAGLPAALDTTRTLLADTADRRPLFEATLQHQGLLVRLDVLLRDGPGPRIVEVKAGTRLKEEYPADCAIQAWVARGAGLDFDRFSVALVDTGFVYLGDGDYRGLLREEDVTGPVMDLQPEVPRWLAAARAALAGGEPEVRPGRRCTTPNDCCFQDYCWSADTAYPIRGLGGNRDLLGELLAAGYRDIRDVPAGRLANAGQERIRRLTVVGEPWRDPAVATALASLPWPRYYLDFETFAPAVPRFAGTRPYEAVPFQFSVHRQDRPGQPPAELAHQSFLDLSGQDPRPPCAAALLGALGTGGPILVYTRYEAGVIDRLARHCQALAPALGALKARLVDLHPLTRTNYYHPDMLGSWSLKAVLPTIDPAANYGDLGEIQDGGAASRAYAEAIDPRTEQGRRDRLRADLEAYCAFDTLALARLAAFLTG